MRAKKVDAAKEFLNAVENITKEKGIDPEIVYSAMELALQSAYKKNFNSKTNVKVQIDRTTGEIKVFSYLTVVEDDKKTKEEYEDELFERYALDEDLDTEIPEEKKKMKKQVKNLKQKKKKKCHSLILIQKLNYLMLRN